MWKSRSPEYPDKYVSSSSYRTSDCRDTVRRAFEEREDDTNLVLLRKKHISYLLKSARGLSQGFTSLDASVPWLIYWTLNGLDLLDSPIPFKEKWLQRLADCQSPDGGFGGGSHQLPHLATTYASVLALSILDVGFDIVDFDSMRSFLRLCKDPSGGFKMHDDGEVDIRGSYCALVTMKLLGIDDEDLIDGIGRFAESCQTYAGGIAAHPFAEAHGGYAFCGLACLLILGGKYHSESFRPDLYTSWCCFRQLSFEGGFSGRPNKLVDSCYSTWVGHSIKMISAPNYLFDPLALQEYVYLACQQLEGGFVDKPGKHRDLYHTCYSMLPFNEEVDPVYNIKRCRVKPLPSSFDDS